jgi:hypothetical protein
MYRLCIKYNHSFKAKPAAKWGRKATGLNEGEETAGLP